MSQCTFIQNRLEYRFRDDFGYIKVEACRFGEEYTHIDIRYFFYNTKKRYRTVGIAVTKTKKSHNIKFKHYPKYENEESTLPF